MTITETRIIRKINTPSQRLLNALLRGEKLSHIDILTRYGIYHAASAIRHFRNRGHNIITHMVEESGKRYGVYHLIK